MKPILLLSYCTLIVLVCGCKKTETPSFLHIEQIDLKVPSNFEQGTDDHHIVDARVYLNDNLVGIYEMPATVPIIASGTQKIAIIAGVLNNGIQSARINYPFYEQYETNLTLIPGDTIDFSGSSSETNVVNGYFVPVVEYFETGLVFWNERFEPPGDNFEVLNTNSAEFTITNDPEKVFDYNPEASSEGSGRALLTQNQPYFEAISTHEFDPIKGLKVYVEINYKSDAVLQVGVYETAPSQAKVYGKGIFPKDDWSKIYIELTEEIAQRANATSYSLFIEGNIGAGDSEAEVLIDNVKLIYPE